MSEQEREAIKRTALEQQKAEQWVRRADILFGVGTLANNSLVGKWDAEKQDYVLLMPRCSVA